jgi:hypothetical protein
MYPAIPFVIIALPGIAVYWMTWLHEVPAKIGIVFIFNTCFYTAAIFSIREVIHHKRTSKSLQPSIGLASLVILMVFVGVYNSGNHLAVVGTYLVPAYPAWGIYVFGLLVALTATIRSRKGWVYLLSYLCMLIPVLVLARQFMHVY